MSSFDLEPDDLEPKTFWGRFDRLIHDAFANTESKLYQAVRASIVVLIFITVALIVLETVESLRIKYGHWFTAAEAIIVAIFTVEYAANLYVARPRRSYALGAWGIIDLLAILPSYVQFVNLQQFQVARVLRILRFLRLLRVLKLAKTVSDGFQESKDKQSGTLGLDLQIYFLTMFSVLVISATLVYYAENNQPGTLFTDIPASLWWAVMTMTTVGYGDIVPVTIVGRILAGLTALCGLGLFAMLTQVVGRALIYGLFGTESDGDHLVDEDAAHAAADAALGSASSIFMRIEMLADSRDQGQLTQEEFEEHRDRLLDRL